MSVSMVNARWKRFQWFFFTAALLLLPIAAHAGGFRFTVAAYNVENLFDMTANHTEYPEFVPDSRYGWNQRMLDIKLNHIGRVIRDLDPDVIGLEEIESAAALRALQRRIAKMGVDYPYAAIAGEKNTTVRCAILSKFPIVSKKEIPVPGRHARNILEVRLDIHGRPLIVFVNHWKSKTGPESARLVYARALADAVSRLGKDTDYLLVGDFNADYNESDTLPEHPALNDTHGIAGINQVLDTETGGRLVTEAMLLKAKKRRLHYNLWLELPPSRRWSIDFFGRKGTPDAILLPRGLYDGKGIAYVDNSFGRFTPAYLFKNGRIYRWQRAADGHGRHLGKGYSDHLPVFARFTTAPFVFSEKSPVRHPKAKKMDIADLYGIRSGSSACYRLYDCVVVYKSGDSAVIQQKNGRAVYLFHAAAELTLGGIYRLTVSGLHRYHGNLEIKRVFDAHKTGTAGKLSDYYLNAANLDYTKPDLRNEVVERCDGVYRNGVLHYGRGRHIRVYFTRKRWVPENGRHIVLSGVRIGYHDHPELVVEKAGQVAVRK